MSIKPCRYLRLNPDEETGYCAYYDMALKGHESIRCYPHGWECYEEPGGVIYENGRWLSLAEYLEYVEEKNERELPDGIEHMIPDVIDGKTLVDLLRWEKK